MKKVVVLFGADRKESEKMERQVVVIPAEKSISEKIGEHQKTRVAAYCRVSTKSDEQLNSYFHQISYYIAKIEENSEWEFVDIYADEGISGTKAKFRDEFNRMMDDCRKGRINLILVKSISRFARNTEECLRYIRELRSLNIDVYFESENIHGNDMSSEFMISIHAMHAQEQSISISKNQRWAIQKRMKSGIWIPNFTGYGYLIKDEELVKDHKVEKIVDTIKELYLNGYSMQKIVLYLDKEKIPSPNGCTCWNDAIIRSILQNPLYRGCLEAQRTYRTESFPFERRYNHGELPKYLYYDDHEAYINQEEAEKIDQIMMIRREVNGALNSRGKSFNRNYLSGKVYCGECGTKMKRVIYSQSKKIAYSCKQHIQDKTKCSNRSVLETTIQSAFLKMCGKLKAHEEILETYKNDLASLKEQAEKSQLSEKRNQQYQSINQQIQQTAVSYNRGLCESAFYIQEIKRLREEKRKVLQLQKENDKEEQYSFKIENTKRIQRRLAQFQYDEVFDEAWFTEIVDQVIAKDQTKITFRLINGLEITEKMEV